MFMELEKTYIAPGDILRVRHDIENRPLMWAVEKVSRLVRNDETNEREPMFVGIKCRWFDKNQCLQEAVLSTKDLEIVK